MQNDILQSGDPCFNELFPHLEGNRSHFFTEYEQMHMIILFGSSPDKMKMPERKRIRVHDHSGGCSVLFVYCKSVQIVVESRSAVLHEDGILRPYDFIEA